MFKNIIIHGVYHKAAFISFNYSSMGGVYWKAAFIGTNTVVTDFLPLVK